ncbi:MAG: hypothetical protein H0X26_03305 [Alphaproteobacteria bacterium]|nr:hypothetical protein [Alphaproteobacteria bacterium]
MENKEKYLNGLQSHMKKYANKVSQLDSKLKNYKAHNKEQLSAERKELAKKFEKAEAIYTKLKAASQENFEEIKNSAEEIFETFQEAFQDFSNSLTMDQIYRMKDDVAAYGSDKVEDIEGYIKKRPLASVAVIFGIGVLIGTILIRSK